jgi:hypothetical protein
MVAAVFFALVHYEPRACHRHGLGNIGRGK